MSLSKRSRAVYVATTQSTDICRLIGEFLGTDLPLKPRDKFYDLEIGGLSFIACNFEGFRCVLGKNIHLNEWTVRSRTPKSYILKYCQTIVVCAGDVGVTYRFKCELAKYSENKIKRVFPFRRTQPNASLLQNLCERASLILSCGTKTRESEGDFYRDFSKKNLK